MLNETQYIFVIKHLVKHNKISRNFALSKFISRLSAIIYNLKDRGWIFKSGFVKTAYGQDYVYYVLSRPKINGK